jgi:hypothetical protein
MMTLLTSREFRAIELEHRDPIRAFLHTYQPETSELTFTNLYIWRDHYAFRWSRYEDWLFVLGTDSAGKTFALPPVGPAPRVEVTRTLLQWLSAQDGPGTRIERADQRLVTELEGTADLIIEPTREHFDYVYTTKSLITLEGRKLHSKRNHINQFQRTYAARYAPLQDTHIGACLELTETWCEWRRCEEDMNLLDEWEVVREALGHWQMLGIQGGVILIDDQVQAFALGEKLNDSTAVVHIEKANSEIRGLFAVINQQFCEHAWAGLTYVNREQDLGEEGLRKAKLSYYPDHMVAKYRIRLA